MASASFQRRCGSQRHWPQAAVSHAASRWRSSSCWHWMAARCGRWWGCYAPSTTPITTTTSTWTVWVRHIAHKVFSQALLLVCDRVIWILEFLIKNKTRQNSIIVDKHATSIYSTSNKMIESENVNSNMLGGGGGGMGRTIWSWGQYYHS